ncbi:OmpH family outer membrane protein [Mariniblastus sp.]|nr:OmpH family outer membrane protein [Mariniblastus sp.]MDB4671042.1 OmpH family outer membrane protein [Pirellulaceae bacterium]MDB4756216.1 OmpH family outer membrane protein [Mariniblastus sp.]
MKSLNIVTPAFFCLLVLGTGLNAQQGKAPGLVTVLDVAKVFENHPTFKAKMNALKNEVGGFQKSVRDQVTDLTKRRQNLPQELKIGSAEFKKAEETLARQEADLKITTSQTEREFMDKEAKLYYNTYLEVQNLVAGFAKANNISLVLRFDSSNIDKSNRASVSSGVNRFIVYQEQLDLTDLIIKEVAKSSAQAGIQNGPNLK